MLRGSHWWRRFYISYTTIVAADVNDGDQRLAVRLHNDWGPTTGRHMKDMGVYDYKEVSDSEINRLVRVSLLRAGQQVALDKLERKST
jgi:hypothetical protein